MRNIGRHITSILSRPSHAFSQLKYSSTICNKFIVTRTKIDRYSLYLSNDLTIGQFLAALNEVYPNRNIGVSTNVNYMLEIGAMVDVAREAEERKEMQDVPLIDALVLNRLVVYEKDDLNIMRLIYGVEIAEFNMTNRINIPEHVEEGVVELATDLSQARMTVGQAFSFDNIRKYEDGDLARQKGVELQNKLTEEEEAAFEQSIMQLIRIKKFNEQIGPYLPSTNKLMKRIITFLSINWVFLFYLTYGKYGWDVGEPVSYLTGLAVDLTAMMGLFEANSALISQKEKDRKLIESIVNLDANEHMAKWRVAYLMRKIS